MLVNEYASKSYYHGKKHVLMFELSIADQKQLDNTLFEIQNTITIWKRKRRRTSAGIILNVMNCETWPGLSKEKHNEIFCNDNVAQIPLKIMLTDNKGIVLSEVDVRAGIDALKPLILLKPPPLESWRNEKNFPMVFEDGWRVGGHIDSEISLKTLARRLSESGLNVEIRKSATFDTGHYILVQYPDIDLKIYEESRFAITAYHESFEHLAQHAKEFSNVLTALKLLHRIEILDGTDNVTLYLNYGWPEGEYNPAGS